MKTKKVKLVRFESTGCAGDDWWENRCSGCKKTHIENEHSYIQKCPHCGGKLDLKSLF